MKVCAPPSVKAAQSSLSRSQQLAGGTNSVPDNMVARVALQRLGNTLYTGAVSGGLCPTRGDNWNQVLIFPLLNGSSLAIAGDGNYGGHGSN